MKQHKHTLMLATALAVGFLMCACVVPLYMFPYTVEQLLDMQAVPVTDRNTFLLGSSDDLLDGDARPTHDVTLLNGFYMSRHPITQSQFQAVMGYNHSHFQEGSGGAAAVSGLNTAHFPVENVNWYEAIVFANRLSMREGLSPVYQIRSETAPSQWETDPYYWGAIPSSSDLRWNAVQLVHRATGYRLPTEAQWEFAVRAIHNNVVADRAAYHTGASITNAQANFLGGLPNRTSAVGSYPANANGLFDMHGNVFEWVWDWFSPYTADAKTEPENGSGVGTFRVTRGGGWRSQADRLRSAARGQVLPEARSNDTGFRVIRPF